MATPVKHAKKGIFREGNIPYTTIFSSLGNETRLRCLFLAARHGEVCVCEAVEALGISQPTISKAFKGLKSAGLVADRRDANWTYFRLDEAMPRWLGEVVDVTIEALSRSSPYLEDEQRFEKSVVRETDTC